MLGYFVWEVLRYTQESRKNNGKLAEHVRADGTYPFIFGGMFNMQVVARHENIQIHYSYLPGSDVIVPGSTDAVSSHVVGFHLGSVSLSIPFEHIAGRLWIVEHS